MRRLLLMFALFAAVPAAAAATFPVKIMVEDSAGVVVKDELVIVQDLDNGEHEVLRALSDQAGNIPTLLLPSGLYRVIATTPYGLWQTGVREFLVGQQSTEVAVRVQQMPTHGYGDIVNIGTTRVQLQVIGSDGEPAIGAQILIRDRGATLCLERWYNADNKGIATIELVSEPTVAVVIYADTLVTTELGQNDSNPVIRLQKHRKQNMWEFVRNKNGTYAVFQNGKLLSDAIPEERRKDEFWVRFGFCQVEYDEIDRQLRQFGKCKLEL